MDCFRPVPHDSDFNPLQPFPSTVMAWIRLPGLSRVLYKYQIREEIGGLIGKVANLDFKIDSGSRRQCAQMTVFINLDKSLVSQILMNDMIQRIEYKPLPMCAFCVVGMGMCKISNLLTIYDQLQREQRGNSGNFT